MDTPLVSIVMPSYNSISTISKSIHSILNQSYRNIELICVDDGSTDETCGVVKEIALTDPRITLIKQQNKGAGAARNSGLDRANGKYVVFLDSDDLFSHRMIDTMIECAEKVSADIVVCDYYMLTSTWVKQRAKVNLSSNQVISAEELRSKMFQIDPGVPWNKMYRTRFIKDNKIKFQNIKNTNDIFFTHCAFLRSKVVYHVSQPLVYYRMNNSNSLQGRLSKNPLCYLDALESICEFLIADSNLVSYRDNFIHYICELTNNKFEKIGSYRDYYEACGRIHHLFTVIGVDTNSFDYDYFNNIYNEDYTGAIFTYLIEERKLSVSKKCLEYRIGSFLTKLFR